MNQISIKQVIEDMKAEKKESKLPMLLNCNAKDFKKLYLLIGDQIVAEGMTANKKYEINKENKESINQLYFWITGNLEGFNGELKKGILLMGGFGTGKSTMARIIAKMFEKLTNKRIKYLNAFRLNNPEIVEILSEYYAKPLIIDEIGKENTSIKIYGTDRMPMIELLTERYDRKSFTIGTTNFNLESLKEKYGGYIEDRIKEMFNVIELKGKSRR